LKRERRKATALRLTRDFVAMWIKLLFGVFHFGEFTIADVKKDLAKHGFPIRA
jgi:imidazole glycerol phosphate synthase subunit HisF